MQLDSIELYQLSIPLKQSYGCPGYKQNSLDTILARVWIGDTYGWGEVSAESAPRTSDQWAEGIFFAAESLLAPLWVGEEFTLPSDLTDKWANLRGVSSAQCLLESAMLDAAARIASKPLYEYIRPDTVGGFSVSCDSSESVFNPINVFVPLDQTDNFDLYCCQIENAVKEGYRFFEVKIRPGWDISMLNGIADILSGCKFHLSFDGGLTDNQADLLYRFSDYHPIFFDQPFAYNDLIPAAQIQDSLTAPLGLNCAVDSKQAISIAADLGAAEIIGINPQQCGGLIASKQRLTDCRNLNLSSRIWNRLTSPLGTRQLLSLAWQAKDSLINKFTGSCGVNCYPIPYWNASDWFEQNLFEPDFPSDSDSGKVIKPWSEPGLGIDPDEDLLEDFTEQKFEIS